MVARRRIFVFLAAAVTVDWNGKHLRNEHLYSGFKLFQVAATEKQGKPNELRQKKR